MANPYFTVTGNPAANASGSSSTMRTQFANIGAGFDKFPALTANKLLRVNNGGTALTASTVERSSTSTWTPVLTFVTPGDLSATYGVSGGYTTFGPFCLINCTVETSVFTHTTASGNLKITGLPFASVGSSDEVYLGTCSASGMTTSYTEICAYVASGTEVLFGKMAQGLVEGFIDTSNATSGVQKRIDFSLIYRII